MWHSCMFHAWVLAAVLAGTAALPAVAQDEDFGGLPPGDGRETVYYTCTACHSTRIILQQGMSRSRWDHTLDWMVAKQGMPEPAPEVREEILAYLAASFPEDRGTTAAGAGGAAGGAAGGGMTPRPAMGIALPPMPGG